MSSAANHKKRNHRSERRAAVRRSRPNRVILPYGAAANPVRGWMRSMFRKIGRQERGAEGAERRAEIAAPYGNDMQKERGAEA